jgi:DNA-binding transcriptional ArsR family regulator
MTETPDISAVAAAIGDASRAAMLTALMDGRALPASLLAYRAGVSPPTASAHLAKLVGAGLLTMQKEGRERCYRLAGGEVAHALEALMAVAPAREGGRVPATEPPETFRAARLCYDHLAGKLGVELLQALLERRVLQWAGSDFSPTAKGERWLRDFGIEIASVRKQRRNLARQCMDLTERRYHLAGSLGAHLTRRMFELGWFEREPEGRAVRITSAGKAGWRRAFAPEFSR